jgi:hypothetical protein
MQDMDDRRDEYLKLMEVFLACGNALRGKKLAADMSWQTYIEPIALKCIYHLGSLYAIYNGTNLPNMLGQPIGYIDFPSMAILTRAAFETYLTFHYIFVHPATVEEKKFLYDIWVLGGLKDRQRFFVTTPEGRVVLQREKQQIEQLKESITSNLLFPKLPGDRQKEAIKGKWRFNKGWADLAELADTHKGYFTGLYAYLCSHAHSGYLSVMQLSQANNQGEQRQLGRMYPGIGLTIMSSFIHDYCGLFPEAQAVLDSNEKYEVLVDAYNISIEKWEEYIQNERESWTKPRGRV